MSFTTPTVPPEWQRLLAGLERGTVLLVGELGTGKSHLARYLLTQLDRALPRAALVDADVGQSSIGVPACLGLALTAPWRAPESLWFVGDVTPRAHLLPVVVGTARLVERARGAGAEMVIVDTGGWVQDPAGRVLKVHKALAAGADQVVALERGGELAPLLDLLAAPGRVIHRLAPVAEAKNRPPEVRREYRESRFRAHFAGAAVRWFGRRKLIGRDWLPGSGCGLAPGTVLGLLGGDGFCLGLGLLEEVGRDRLAVFTAVSEDQRVARLQAGALTLDRRDLEPGRARPGKPGRDAP